jgi:hypothetical protein
VDIISVAVFAETTLWAATKGEDPLANPKDEQMLEIRRDRAG